MENLAWTKWNYIILPVHHLFCEVTPQFSLKMQYLHISSRAKAGYFFSKIRMRAAYHCIKKKIFRDYTCAIYRAHAHGLHERQDCKLAKETKQSKERVLYIGHECIH